MTRKRKLESPVRVSIYIDGAVLDRIEEIARFRGLHRQDLIRLAIDNYLEKNEDVVCYECPKCDFVLKVSSLDSEVVDEIIERHKRDCGG